MEIEEEIAELKAELERRNENVKTKRFVEDQQYRVLLKKQSSKICEICGKEYKITHLCETGWNFEWGDFWKHYTSYQTAKSAPPQITIAPKTLEPIKTQLPAPPSQKSDKKNSNNCGICICIIIIVIIVIIFV